MTRDDYLTDLVSFCARPIGGATRMGVILNYIEKDFMDFPIDMVFDKERVPKINKNIRRHAKYSELFYEISEIEEEKGQTNGAPHQLALFDTVNDSMLIITNYSSEKLPMQIVPLNNHIKQRIYANYGLNFFPHSPCNTLADLMDKAPHDDEILSHSDDYPAKNDHQRERIKWLYDYKDKMFETKARNVTSSFSVPIFANPSLLCVSRGSRNTSLYRPSAAKRCHHILRQIRKTK